MIQPIHKLNDEDLEELYFKTLADPPSDPDEEILYACLEEIRYRKREENPYWDYLII